MSINSKNYKDFLISSKKITEQEFFGKLETGYISIESDEIYLKEFFPSNSEYLKNVTNIMDPNAIYRIDDVKAFLAKSETLVDRNFSMILEHSNYHRIKFKLNDLSLPLEPLLSTPEINEFANEFSDVKMFSQEQNNVFNFVTAGINDPDTQEYGTLEQFAKIFIISKFLKINPHELLQQNGIAWINVTSNSFSIVLRPNSQMILNMNPLKLYEEPSASTKVISDFFFSDGFSLESIQLDSNKKGQIIIKFFAQYKGVPAERLIQLADQTSLNDLNITSDETIAINEFNSMSLEEYKAKVLNDLHSDLSSESLPKDGYFINSDPNFLDDIMTLLSTSEDDMSELGSLSGLANLPKTNIPSQEALRNLGLVVDMSKNRAITNRLSIVENYLSPMVMQMKSISSEPIDDSEKADLSKINDKINFINNMANDLSSEMNQLNQLASHSNFEKLVASHSKHSFPSLVLSGKDPYYAIIDYINDIKFWTLRSANFDFESTKQELNRLEKYKHAITVGLKDFVQSPEKVIGLAVRTGLRTLNATRKALSITSHLLNYIGTMRLPVTMPKPTLDPIVRIDFELNEDTQDFMISTKKDRWICIPDYSGKISQLDLTVSGYIEQFMRNFCENDSIQKVKSKGSVIDGLDCPYYIGILRKDRVEKYVELVRSIRRIKDYFGMDQYLNFIILGSDYPDKNQHFYNCVLTITEISGVTAASTVQATASAAAAATKTPGLLSKAIAAGIAFSAVLANNAAELVMFQQKHITQVNGLEGSMNYTTKLNYLTNTNTVLELNLPLKSMVFLPFSPVKNVIEQTKLAIGIAASMGGAIALGSAIGKISGSIFQIAQRRKVKKAFKTLGKSVDADGLSTDSSYNNYMFVTNPGTGEVIRPLVKRTRAQRKDYIKSQLLMEKDKGKDLKSAISSVLPVGDVFDTFDKHDPLVIDKSEEIGYLRSIIDDLAWTRNRLK